MFSADHLHPMLVHFPIALTVFGFIAEVASLFFKKEACLSKTGFYLLVLGALTALTAWLSGNFFTGEMSGAAGEIKETHELFAGLTLGALLVTALIRIILKVIRKEDSNLKWVVFALYLAAAILVSVTGFYGGTLVYNYMMPL
jgi:uncharacterized membrane protein